MYKKGLTVAPLWIWAKRVTVKWQLHLNFYKITRWGNEGFSTPNGKRKFKSFRVAFLRSSLQLRWQFCSRHIWFQFMQWLLNPTFCIKLNSFKNSHSTFIWEPRGFRSESIDKIGHFNSNCSRIMSGLQPSSFCRISLYHTLPRVKTPSSWLISRFLSPFAWRFFELMSFFPQWEEVLITNLPPLSLELEESQPGWSVQNANRALIKSRRIHYIANLFRSSKFSLL